MRRFFAMLRYSKKMLAFTICAVIDFCVMLGLIIFDVVQYVSVKNNAASLSSAFISVNIVLIVWAVMNISVIFGFVFYKKRKEKLNDSKEN